MRVMLMFLPPGMARKIGETLSGITNPMVDYIPNIKTDLELCNVGMNPAQYLGASLASALLLAEIMFAIVAVPMKLSGYPGVTPILVGVFPAFLIFLMDFVVLMKYPRILALKRGEMVDRELIFAIKDLLLNTSAGLSLYDSVARVSKNTYGFVSEDFKWVINKTNEGIPLDGALELLALNSSSEYMRNALWQIINAYRSGASVKSALTLLVRTLIKEQQRKIREYTQELNVLTMMYMLFAVAVPSIVLTLAIVLTSFTGAGITPEVYVLIVSLCIGIQVIVLFLIKSRRPLIYLD